MRLIACLLLSASFVSPVLAADTPRAGWYTDRTEMSMGGQAWQEASRGPAGGGFCVLGLGEAELEQLYRQSAQRDQCQLQQVQISGGKGSAAGVCNAQGVSVRMTATGRYASDRFDMQSEMLLARQGQAGAFSIKSRSQAQRVRDCTAEERQASQQAVEGSQRP